MHVVLTYLIAAICLLNVAVSGQAFTSEQTHTVLSSGSQIYNDNVVVVFDASGSMKRELTGTRQTRMDVAQNSLAQVLAQVPQTTNIGFYVFSGKQQRKGWLYPLGPNDQDRLQAAVRQASPGGGTPLGASIRQGANALLKQRAEQKGYGTYRLLVVTDGKASDEKVMEEIVPIVLSRGITVDVIGLDMQQSHTLATKVHNYRDARDPVSLTSALQASFAEVNTGDQALLDEQFAVVSGLDSAVASAAITALATTGNQQIIMQTTSSSQHRVQSNSTQSPQQPSSSSSGSVNWQWLFVIGIVGFFILKNVFKGKS